MIQLKEQYTCIEFCLKLGKNATETFKMLIVAFGEQLMQTTQVFMRFSKFKSSVTSAGDANTQDVHWSRKQTKSVSSEGHSPQTLSNKSTTKVSVKVLTSWKLVLIRSERCERQSACVSDCCLIRARPAKQQKENHVDKYKDLPCPLRSPHLVPCLLFLQTKNSSTGKEV
jgi:hypothetical protein